jgi:hypothetical protein
MNNRLNGGFQCWTCREIFDSMWGETCNGCRDTEKRHKELIAAIKSTKTE